MWEATSGAQVSFDDGLVKASGKDHTGQRWEKQKSKKKQEVSECGGGGIVPRYRVGKERESMHLPGFYHWHKTQLGSPTRAQDREPKNVSLGKQRVHSWRKASREQK